MAYEQRNLRRQKVRYNDDNDDNKLEYQLVLDGAKVTPTSATITIYKPGSTTAVVSAASMTLSGSVLQYAPDTTTVANYPVDEGYRADLAITYSGVVYKRQLVFDVAKYLLDLNIGYDQLVAFDDSIRGMTHDGDEDFSELIESCRDVLQTRIESKVLEDGRLLENMILDNTRVATCARFYILSRIYMNKGDLERHDLYRNDFDQLFDAVLNSIQYDKAQGGEERAEMGGIQEVRLVT